MLAPVLQDVFHLGPRLHPLVQGVELAPQPVRRLVQVPQGFVQFVLLLPGHRLLRLGRGPALRAPRGLGCLRLLLSLLGPVLGPIAELIDAVFHFANAVADLCFRKRGHLREYRAAQGEADEDGSGERLSFRA